MTDRENRRQSKSRRDSQSDLRADEQQSPPLGSPRQSHVASPAHDHSHRDPDQGCPPRPPRGILKARPHELNRRPHQDHTNLENVAPFSSPPPAIGMPRVGEPSSHFSSLHAIQGEHRSSSVLRHARSNINYKQNPNLQSFNGTYTGSAVKGKLERLRFMKSTLVVEMTRREGASLCIKMQGFMVGSIGRQVDERAAFVTRTSMKKHSHDPLSKGAMATMLLPFMDLGDPGLPTTAVAYGTVGSILVEILRLRSTAALEYGFDCRTGYIRYEMTGFDLPWGYYEEDCGFGLAFLNYVRDHIDRPYVRLDDRHEADLEKALRFEDHDYILTLRYRDEPKYTETAPVMGRNAT